MYQNELYHHGIMGMKWGVRRYQNFDGSYTKEGLKRYRSSEENYNKKKAEYKTIRKDKTASRYTKKMAKANVKESKLDLQKKYNQLKWDKLGDKGKAKYKKGMRIRYNNKMLKGVSTASGIATAGAYYLYAAGKISQKDFMKVLAASAAADLGTLGVGAVVNKVHNDPLRAYYSHSRND